MNKKNIALFTMPGPWSGVEAHTVEFANALSAKGHKVFVIEVNSTAYSNSGKFDDASFLSISTKEQQSDQFVSDQSSITQWKAQFSPLQLDIIVIIKGTFDFGNLAIELAARACCNKLVAIEHMHAPLPTEDHNPTLFQRLFKGWWRKKARIRGYIRSIVPHKVICVSNASAKTLTQDYFYPTRKVCVCHSGVDLENFQPNSHARAAIRSKFNIDEQAIVFGSVGRLSPMKNHTLMINGFANLLTTHPTTDAHLLIVGDGPLKTELVALCHNKNIVNRVHFAGFSDKPKDYYCAFDIFCLTSTGEAFPLVLLEAMATNNRPIATDVGGVNEGFSNDIGSLIPSNNLIALTKAMEKAVLDIESGQFHIGGQPRNHMTKYFAKQKKLDQLVSTVVT